MRFARLWLGLVALAPLACFGAGPRPDRAPAEPAAPLAIDLASTHQTIDGFGASSAWTAGNISDAEADQLFSTTTGAGLSLLRLRIAPDGTTGELGTARKAAARGAKVWAAPWSPPVEWKTGADSFGYAGSLTPDDRQPWADRLAAFARMMSDQGMPLAALSAQNEPNFPATGMNGWESCIYSPAELVGFVRDFLGPALAAEGLTTPVMAPESKDWSTFDSFAVAFAADASAMNFMGPFAAHAYGGTPHLVSAVQASGRHVWETEVSDRQGTSGQVDVGMDSALRVAQMIHANLVSGEVSAWHYWWIHRGSGRDNSALVEAGQLTRRGWAMGNWSRFVRPGFVRVGAMVDPQAIQKASAFVDPAAGTVVIVVINPASVAVAQDLTVTGGTLGTATPYVTSTDLALAAQDAVPVVDGAFSFTLPARSVTTFVATP